MNTIDREILNKKSEIETLTRMLDNAKRDLRVLENNKKAQEKKNVTKM